MTETRATALDAPACALGEGPLWHPGRARLYWFDILQSQMHSSDGQVWSFDEMHSAAGWVDEDTLLIASEHGLWRFSLTSGAREPVCSLEADNALTRSNDGRADPMGGFWIGTMGKQAEPGAGAIYRYYRGDLRQLVPDVSIPNAICFSGDGRLAYYADTAKKLVWRQALDSDGWPEGPAVIFLDLEAQGLNPDGAVTDAEDHLWLALWGAGQVIRITPDGVRDHVVCLDARHSTCPAFGGPRMRHLYVTSAQEGIPDPDTAQGRLYQAEVPFTGRPEPRVIL